MHPGIQKHHSKMKQNSQIVFKGLFDIAHSNALGRVKIEEHRAFLLLQRFVFLTQPVLIGLFSGTISISSQMAQCRIILLLQPITKFYLFTNNPKLRDDFRCFRSKMRFRTFSTVSLNSPIQVVSHELALYWNSCLGEIFRTLDVAITSLNL